MAGTYTPTATVIDQGTGTVYAYPAYPDLRVNPPITIFSAVIIGGNIVVGGTAGNDNIKVDANNPNNVIVTIGGVAQANPAGGLWVVNPATGRIIVDGCAGADTIQIVGGVKAEVHGGAGNDVITGGTSDDVLWGDAGDDFIQGGTGNDVVIGGAGNDRIYGDAGDDILVAGEFIANSHNGTENYGYSVLRAICDAWAAGSGGAAGAAAADPDLATPADDVSDTTTGERLTGGSGKDWFIASAGDIIDALSGGDFLQTI